MCAGRRTGVCAGPGTARPGQAAILEILRNAVELYPPLAGAQAIRTWSGTEGYLPDREPVLGASSRQPGLLHGFGFAGSGFQIGPAAGEALAQMVCAGASNIDLGAFSINRFQTHPQLHLQTQVPTPAIVVPSGTDNVIPLFRGRSKP